MWGDPERAFKLEPSDALYVLLLQITGPAHIPCNDPRWQELLYGYDVWVHLEGHSVPSACTSMAKHASTSCNLAALCLHVARMMREFVSSHTQTKGEDFTHTIALVGKARATAGALNLLRILLHHVLVETTTCPNLTDVFTYRTRDITERHRADRHAGHDLLHASLAFLSMEKKNWTAVPELYDTTNLCLQLVLVMLSTQLYQPMVSSLSRKNNNYFMDIIMSEARKRSQDQHDTHVSALVGEPTELSQPKVMMVVVDWTPASILQTCLSWQVSRPVAPERSIAHHYSELTQSVVQTKEKRVGPDGMYESHLVVMASRPKGAQISSTTTTQSLVSSSHASKPPSHFIWDATRGILVLSSSLIMLPFRLMSLAFGLWSHPHDYQYDQARKQHMKTFSNRTNDVLWLSNSPVADLGSSLLLLLVHNYRANGIDDGNPFRAVLGELGDNRWDGGGTSSSMDDPLLATPPPHENGNTDDSFVVNQEGALLSQPALLKSSDVHLTTNFESLFESFGDTLHTEMGALLLYTLLQSSSNFASFLVVRSDLDTLVLPLLRTLYFSSSLKHYSPLGTVAGGIGTTTSAVSLKSSSCPFRSPSQLYVILILLLLFSQDASFGPDAFRRNIVSTVPWYKERNLKDINLGSLLLLTLLRSITFNLSKLHDAFLLSNCCAVLMNLSHNIVHLHEYASMRLVSVCMLVLKKHASLRENNGGRGINHQEDDITTPLGMYAEVSHTLLRILRHCVGPKNIDSNLQLVYALVYHQADFYAIVSKKTCPVKKSELACIQTVISSASSLIQKDGDARTAPKAMHVLQENMSLLQEAVASHARDDSGDFTFTYEEEADPEIFFIPYVWEVIVCVVTASSMEWEKNKILVFPLLEEEDQEEEERAPAAPTAIEFAADVSDVV